MGAETDGMTRAGRRLIGALTVLLLLWAASSPAGAATLRRPSFAEPDTLDPQKTTSANAQGIDADLFTGLVTLSEHGQPVPGVASSWEVSPDGRIWTFHLRPDALWSNGDPVTAEDFVYSFRRLVDPKTAAGDTSDLERVVNAKDIIAGREPDLIKLGVDSLDAHTLRLRLVEPQAILLLLLTDNLVVPLHRATLEQWGNDWTRPEHIVTNGAFLLKSWTPQSEIVLARNPGFFDAATVKLDEVRWIVTGDLAAGLRRYQAGELDWIGLDRQSLPWAKEHRPAELRSAPALAYDFLFFNMTRGPWATDRRIREALSLALDRTALVTKIDPRDQHVAFGVVPEAISNYTSQAYAWKDEPQAERLARAKALLAEAGYGPDHRLAIAISYPTGETAQHILLAIRAMWQSLGVDVTLQNSEWQIYVQKINGRDYDMGIVSEDFPYDDAEHFLDLFRSDAGTLNLQSYANPAFDTLLHRASTTLDPVERRQLLEAAERVVLADYPVVPIEMSVTNRLASPKLQGMDLRLINAPSRYLYFAE